MRGFLIAKNGCLRVGDPQKPRAKNGFVLLRALERRLQRAGDLGTFEEVDRCCVEVLRGVLCLLIKG